MFAWLWLWLGRRHLDPSIPVKFAYGLLQITILPTIAGVLLMVCAKPIKRWMEGVR